MLFVLKFELFISLVTSCLNLLELSLNLLGDRNLILDVASATTFSELVGAPNVEFAILFNLLQEESIVNVGDDVLALDLVERLGNLLAESVALLLLAHFFIDESHVFVGAFFLSFFCHAKDFAELFADLLNEGGTITNESAFNRVNEGASLLVESVASASLQ